MEKRLTRGFGSEAGALLVRNEHALATVAGIRVVAAPWPIAACYREADSQTPVTAPRADTGAPISTSSLSRVGLIRCWSRAPLRLTSTLAAPSQSRPAAGPKSVEHRACLQFRGRRALLNHA